MEKLPARYSALRYPVLFVLGLLPFFSGKSILQATQTGNAISWAQWTTFSVGLFIFTYTAWCYWTENKLTIVSTKFPKEQNRQILLTVIGELKWTNFSESNNCFWVLTNVHWITLMYEDNIIRYNFRNVGGPLRRLQIGYDSLVISKFRKKLDLLIK